MMLLDILLLVVGAALVLFGADKLTDGATGLARRFNISEMVIGLTVVAFGTSLPEFVTSFVSIMKGSADISMGNVIGSNLFNTLFIVGMAALVSPIKISKSTVQKDIPFALLASLMLVVVSMDSFFDGASSEVLSRTDGIVLLGFFSVFMAYTMFMARNTDVIDAQTDGVEAVAQMSYWRIFLYIILGLAGLVFGGDLFVDSACDIALGLGVSETIVGLTIVAAGTSLPELATSIVAARKGSSAIAIGNVVGSNIFNIFFIMGTCATISPMNVGNIGILDLYLLFMSMVLLWFFSYSNMKIKRWEGGFLMTVYVVYVAYLVFKAVVF